ncbi:MAG: hypothetical protein AAFV93_15760 [Chloroflexota bacterium]
MSDYRHTNLNEFKTQAAILLKQLQAPDTQMGRQAVQRFAQLPYFDVLKPQNTKLKHALAVIAIEQGFETWTKLKQYLERKSLLAQRRNSYFTLLYPARCSGFVLEWHTKYEVANTALGRLGGYLLPYKNQFFICEADYIAELGLDPNDVDWEYIGYNWVNPADKDAWHRLNAKLHKLNAGESND